MSKAEAPNDNSKRNMLIVGAVILILGAFPLYNYLSGLDAAPPHTKDYYTGPEYNKQGDYVVDGKIVKKNALGLQRGGPKPDTSAAKNPNSGD